MTRLEALRPIVTAVGLTLFGEMAILPLWGAWLSPGGPVWPKLLWTATFGVAMGAMIGALTILFVGGRMQNTAGAIYTGERTYCTFLCFTIDPTLGLLAAREAPAMFILGRLISAAASAPTYVWLAVSDHGGRLLTGRAGTCRAMSWPRSSCSRISLRRCDPERMHRYGGSP